MFTYILRFSDISNSSDLNGKFKKRYSIKSGKSIFENNLGRNNRSRLFFRNCNRIFHLSSTRGRTEYVSILWTFYENLYIQQIVCQNNEMLKKIYNMITDNFSKLYRSNFKHSIMVFTIWRRRSNSSSGRRRRRKS